MLIRVCACDYSILFGDNIDAIWVFLLNILENKSKVLFYYSNVHGVWVEIVMITKGVVTTINLLRRCSSELHALMHVRFRFWHNKPQLQPLSIQKIIWESSEVYHKAGSEQSKTTLLPSRNALKPLRLSWLDDFAICDWAILEIPDEKLMSFISLKN